MMNDLKSLSNFALQSGLCIRSMPGVNPDVRAECMDFAKWLRKVMAFPIGITVYLKKEEFVLTEITGENVSATFWGPFDKNNKPYIRISTGDYEQLKEAHGKFNALKSVLGSIAHELTHYQQWLENRKASEREAKKKAKELVYQYIELETTILEQRINILKISPDQSGLAKLFSIFDKGSPDLRLKIIETLASFNHYDQAKQFLICLTSDPDAEISYSALNSLSYFSGDDVRLAVTMCLKDPDEVVRIHAAQALRDVGSVESITPLIQALSDPKELVRGYAAVSLGVLGPKALIPVLKQKLHEEKRNAARLRFYVGLYYLGEIEYFGLILEQLKNRSYLVRLAASHYLVDLADNDNVDVITTASKTSLDKENRSEVRSAISEALKKLEV